MIIALHWDVKKFMKGMSASDKGSKMARLHVLVYLMACANQRFRCWPSIPRMADETGISASTINEAKEWLIEHKALAIVPFEKREGKERAISHRQNVYQLTGVVEIEGKIWSYMLMDDEIKAAIEEELIDLNFDFNVNSERSESNRSNSTKEVIPSSSEGSTNKNLSSQKNATGVETDLSVKGKQPATPKTKNKTPKPPVAPSPLSPAERDALFDAVILHIFKIASPEQFAEAKESDNAGTRAGMIANWLAQGCEKIQNKKVGRISRPATPEHVQKFAAWYATAKPKISIPKDAEKFIEAWREWASLKHAQESQRQQRQQTPTPAAQPLTDEQRQRRQAELAARRNGAAHEHA